MESLPWVILHGHWVWKGGLVLLVALTLFIGWLRPRLSLRRRARRELKRLGEPEPVESAPAGKPVTFSGTLSATGDPTQRFEDGAAAAATTAAPLKPGAVLGALAITRSAESLSLDVGGHQVNIQGELEVLVGSREFYHGKKFRKVPRKIYSELSEADNEALSAMSRHRAAFRSLQVGDRVRVRGFLRRLPDPSAGEGYRAPGDRWVLAAQPEAGSDTVDDRVVAAAYEGRPRVVVLTPLALLRRFLVATAAWGALIAAAGLGFLFFGWPQLSSRVVDLGVDRGFCTNEPISTATLVAVMLPFGHDLKQEQVARSLESQCRWDRTRVMASSEAWLHQGRCGNAALALISHGELARGEEIALTCRDPRTLRATLHALFSVGRFEEASNIAAELLPDAEARWQADWRFITTLHLAAGQQERAASAAQRQAQELASINDSPRRRYTTSRYATEALSYNCLAQALKARAGDAKARAQLGKQSGRGKKRHCSLLLADLQPREERLKSLSWEQRDRDGNVAWPARLLIAEVAPEELARPVDRNRNDLERQPNRSLETWSLSDRGGGLERAVHKGLAGEPGTNAEVRWLRARLGAKLAHRSLLLGELDEARRLSLGVISDLDGLPDGLQTALSRPTLVSIARARLAMIEVEAGRPDAARDLLAQIPEVPRDRRVLDEWRTPLVVQVKALQAFRAGGSFTGMREAGFLRNEQNTQTWLAATMSNGERLAEAFWGRSPRIRRAYRPFWASRIDSGREALHQQVRWGSRERPIRYTLEEIEGNHAWDLQVARALGDEEWVAEIEPVVERFRAVTRRRDIAVLLYVAEWR